MNINVKPFSLSAYFKLLRITCFLILSGVSIMSCNSHSQQESDKNETFQDDCNGRFCFRREFAFPEDPEMKDVEELQLEVTGTTVTGTYHWLPAFKDHRKGHLEGMNNEGTITANYYYIQEGKKDTITLKIVLKEHEAIIESKSAQFGLSTTIDKIDCKQSQVVSEIHYGTLSVQKP